MCHCTSQVQMTERAMPCIHSSPSSPSIPLPAYFVLITHYPRTTRIALVTLCRPGGAGARTVRHISFVIVCISTIIIRPNCLAGLQGNVNTPPPLTTPTPFTCHCCSLSSCITSKLHLITV